MNLGIDLGVLFLAVWVARFWGARPMPGDLQGVVWTFGILASTWIVAAAALRHYSAQNYERGLLDEVAMVAILTFAVLTALAVLHLLSRTGLALPRAPTFLFVEFTTVLVLRLGVFRQLVDREEPTNEVLIVGTGAMGRLTAQDLRERKSSVRVVGHLSWPDETSREADLLQRGTSKAILGTCDELERTLRTVAVDEVYFAGNARKHDAQIQAGIRVCERLGMPFALPAWSFNLQRAQPEERHAISDGYLHYHHQPEKPHQVALKRLFDIVSSAVALWVLLPLFVVVMVLIKITSRGPIFFKQVRAGQHGRTFHMLKFRSMVTNAEELKASLLKLNEQSGPVFKMRNDPRITRIGRFIRKYSIDELPQLINVLRGDMSVVGPRPPVPQEVEKYEPWQRRRLSVRPGLTCIWQVSGRNQISFEDWMLLDMQYIDHWSLAQDFELIFRTVPAIILGRGAS